MKTNSIIDVFIQKSRRMEESKNTKGLGRIFRGTYSDYLTVDEFLYWQLFPLPKGWQIEQNPHLCLQYGCGIIYGEKGCIGKECKTFKKIKDYIKERK